MKTLIIGAVLALAAGTATAKNTSHNPAVKDHDAHVVAAPAKGANSFSEDQARGRLTKAGYTGIGTLAKDKDGVWRGSAMRGGKKVKVGLDYKGNVTTTR